MTANGFKAKHKHFISDTDFEYRFTPEQLETFWKMLCYEQRIIAGDEFLLGRYEPEFKNDYEDI